MKKVLVLGLMAALAIGGCQVKEEGEFAPEGKVFTATMEALDAAAGGVDTKTSLDSYGNVLWKAGDQVSIFAGSTINEHYQVTDASDGKTAAALNRVESPGFVAGGEIPNNVAYYPYAAATAIAKRDGGAYCISDMALPATQTYAHASFGNGAFPMTAVTSSKSDYNLKFMNVLGGLKLQLKGTATIASISITGNNNEILCGAAEVTVSTITAPSISLTDASATTVALDCGDGVQLNAETATPFIVALPPMTMEGGFTVTVTDTEGGQMEIKTTKSQTITRSNLLKMPVVNYAGTLPETTPEAVDLGLPSGLKWASCNVGANSPEEYGDYFAWGDTEPYYSSLSPLTWKDGKTGYNWASYKWCNGSDDTMTKYCTDSDYGTIDNNTVLDSEDDAASANWGGTWRMPTDTEWAELIDECTWTWTTQNGVSGMLFTGSNGNSIFLPAAGVRGGKYRQNTGSWGYYLSSSLNTDNPSDACLVYFYSDYVSRSDSYRYFGRSIRPVSDEGVRVSVTDISLNQNSLTLTEGGTASLTATVTPSNATQPAVIWSSSNKSVATVDYTGKVTAVEAGSATITATTYDGGLTATCAVMVYDGQVDGHYYVDLGLPSGIFWANCNMGATAPEEYGDYYAWGETEEKESYTWGNYKYGNYVSLTKYNNRATYGEIDNLTELEPTDDIATVRLGSKWRIPTLEEGKELLNYCTWEFTTYHNVVGYIATSIINGNSIFFPCAGFKESTLGEVGICGRYWLSSVCTSDESYRDCQSAYRLSLRSPELGVTHEWDWFTRNAGLSIRPVFGFPPKEITLDKSQIVLQPGESYTIVPTITPSDASCQTITWTSGNTSVATVEDGIVTAVSLGTATITAKIGQFCSATCTIKVAEPIDDSFNPNSYIVYKANRTSSTGDDNEDYIVIESSFPGFGRAAVVEMKFQLMTLTGQAQSYDSSVTLGSSNLAKDSYDQLYINVKTGKLNWVNYNDEYFSFDLANNGITYTDPIVLRYSAIDKSFSVNNTSINCNMSYMRLSYVFSEYCRENDEGLLQTLYGVPDGSKLYYVKAYDSNGDIIYLGYADRAINPATGIEEYCWFSHDGLKATYTFAHDSALQGGFSGCVFN